MGFKVAILTIRSSEFLFYLICSFLIISALYITWAKVKTFEKMPTVYICVFTSAVAGMLALLGELFLAEILLARLDLKLDFFSIILWSTSGLWAAIYCHYKILTK